MSLKSPLHAYFPSYKPGGTTINRAANEATSGAVRGYFTPMSRGDAGSTPAGSLAASVAQRQSVTRTPRAIFSWLSSTRNAEPGLRIRKIRRQAFSKRLQGSCWQKPTILISLGLRCPKTTDGAVQGYFAPL